MTDNLSVNLALPQTTADSPVKGSPDQGTQPDLFQKILNDATQSIADNASLPTLGGKDDNTGPANEPIASLQGMKALSNQIPVFQSPNQASANTPKMAGPSAAAEQTSGAHEAQSGDLTASAADRAPVGSQGKEKDTAKDDAASDESVGNPVPAQIESVQVPVTTDGTVTTVTPPTPINVSNGATPGLMDSNEVEPVTGVSAANQGADIRQIQPGAQNGISEKTPETARGTVLDVAADPKTLEGMDNLTGVPKQPVAESISATGVDQPGELQGLKGSGGIADTTIPQAGVPLTDGTKTPSGPETNTEFANLSGLESQPNTVRSSGMKVAPNQFSLSGMEVQPNSVDLSGMEMTPQMITASGLKIRPNLVSLSGMEMQLNSETISGMDLRPGEISPSGIEMQANTIDLSGLKIQPGTITASGIQIEPESASLSGIKVQPNSVDISGMALQPGAISPSGIEAQPAAAGLTGVNTQPDMPDPSGAKLGMQPDGVSTDVSILNAAVQSDATEISGVGPLPENSAANLIQAAAIPTEVQPDGNVLTEMEPQSDLTGVSRGATPFEGMPQPEDQILPNGKVSSETEVQTGALENPATDEGHSGLKVRTGTISPSGRKTGLEASGSPEVNRQAAAPSFAGPELPPAASNPAGSGTINNPVNLSGMESEPDNTAVSGIELQRALLSMPENAAIPGVKNPTNAKNPSANLAVSEEKITLPFSELFQLKGNSAPEGVALAAVNLKTANPASSLPTGLNGAFSNQTVSPDVVLNGGAGLKGGSAATISGFVIKTDGQAQGSTPGSNLYPQAVNPGEIIKNGSGGAFPNQTGYTGAVSLNGDALRGGSTTTPGMSLRTAGWGTEPTAMSAQNENSSTPGRATIAPGLNPGQTVKTSVFPTVPVVLNSQISLEMTGANPTIPNPGNRFELPVHRGAPENFRIETQVKMTETVSAGGRGEGTVENSQPVFTGPALHVLAPQAEAVKEQVFTPFQADDHRTGPEELYPQIIEKAKMMVQNGQQEMEVSLKPDHLGRIQLKVTTDNQQVTARFVAETQQVKEIIEDHLPALRQQLQDTGLKVDVLTVSTGQQNGPGQFQQNANHPSDNAQTGMPRRPSFFEENAPENVHEAPAAKWRLSSVVDFVA